MALFFLGGKIGGGCHLATIPGGCGASPASQSPARIRRARHCAEVPAVIVVPTCFAVAYILRRIPGVSTIL
jgi:hypothetical protein